MLTTKKLKICFIPGKLLPVPDVKGGAIETLLTDMIRENEKHNLIDITVVSVYDKDAVAESKKYQKTKFLFIKAGLGLKIINIYYKLTNVLFKHKKLAYNEEILRRIRNEKFDYIVIEGGAEDYFMSYLKYFDKSQMAYHLHFNGRTTELMEKTFSKVIGVSDFVTNDFKKGSKIERFDTLLNGIDTRRFDKVCSLDNRLQIRQRLGFLDDDFIIIYVGRLIQVKGVLELVKAVKKIKDQKIKLMIVGELNYSDDYQKLLINEVDDKRIKMAGYVANSDLYRYYQASDAQVIPSLWNEAYALIAIEGMLSKIPLIISDSGGMQEIVSKHSLIVKRGEKFIDGLSNAIVSIRRRDIEFDLEANYLYAKGFSSEKMYLNMVKLFNDYSK